MKRVMILSIISTSILLFLAGCGGGGGGGGDAAPLSSDKDITAFSFTKAANTANTAITSDIAGTISETNISVTVPYGTNLTSLVATFTITGTKVQVSGVDQASGSTTNNFASPVTYTVHAADASTKGYTVTVTAAESSDKDITAFSFTTAANPDNMAITSNIAGTISGTDIAVTVPYGTDLTTLVATFTITGTKVQVGGTDQASGATANSFASPVTYTVHAADAGTKGYTVTVTRTDKAWGTAALVENNTGEAQYPQVALDGKGNAIAVWKQNLHVWGSRYTPAGGWGAPVQIESLAGYADNPLVACDPAGNAVIVWEQYNGVPHLYYKFFYAATGKLDATAKLIEDNTTQDASLTSLKCDRSGNAMVMWRFLDASGWHLWSRYFEAGHGWSIPEGVVVSADRSTHSTDFTFDGRGKGIAVWFEDGTGADKVIYAGIFDPLAAAGSRWTTQAIESHNGSDMYPRVAADSTGNAIAVWEQRGVTYINICAVRYNAALGAWGDPGLIESYEGGNANFPAIAFDGLGNAFAVWQQGSSPITLWANRYTPAGGWGSPACIQSDTTTNVFVADLACDSFGNAIVIWQQGSSTTGYDIWSNRYVMGTGWDTGEIIDSSSLFDAYNFNLALDSSGNAMAFWEQDDGTDRSILVNIYK
jgi:hypothetical protein